MASTAALASLVHLNRNFIALLEAMNITCAAFCRRVGMPYRALAYKFSPLPDPRVRATSLNSLTRIAQAAGCSPAYLHLTPADAEEMLGKIYSPDDDLRETEPHLVSRRMASHLREIETPPTLMVRAVIVGVALANRQAAIDWVNRLKSVHRG